MDISEEKNRRSLHSPLLDELSFVQHLFSTRDFGNLGLHIGDDPQLVQANREVFLQEIDGVLENLVAAKQVHGTRVKRVTIKDQGKGAFTHESGIDDCDGLITNSPGLLLFAFFADCTPIFLVDPVQKGIGLIHAGWKGTLGNIAGKSIEAMKSCFGSEPRDIRAVIGPRIGKECYEVGVDLREKLGQLGFNQSPYLTDGHLDLGEINRTLLLNMGLQHIEVDPHCTNCRRDLFYSHRGEQGNTGRMAGIIMIKEEKAESQEGKE